MLKRNRRILDSAPGPATYITPATTIVGKITGSGPYIFSGSIEGECDIDGPVTLAASGSWRGTMRAADLIIAGEMHGDAIANNRVEVAGTARITGSLSGNSIAVSEGAVIDGEIKVISGKHPREFEEKREDS